MQRLGALKEKAAGVFGGGMQRFDQFEAPKHGYEFKTRIDGDSPVSVEEIERPPLRPIDQILPAQCFSLTTRYTVALMACFGFIITFGIRCNLSIANLKLEEMHENQTSATKEERIRLKTTIDSAFFYGYLITQIPGGFLASSFPAIQMFGLAVISSSLLNFTLPAVVDQTPLAVIVIKILQGLVEGITYPACHGIWRFWAPPLERSRLATLAFCGSYAGIVIGMPISGILADWISWKAPFFFYGFMGCCWYLLWLWLVFDKPRNHPGISIEEVKYIERSLNESAMPTMPTISSTPWNEIIRSMPVYAIIVANFCRSWNFYMLVNFQNEYLSQRFHYSLAEAGTLGALPHLIMTIIVPFGGMWADHLRKSGKMTTTNVRKVFNCTGFGVEGFCFLVMAYVENTVVAMVALTIGVAISGFAISGYNVNHLDIAPRYASILMGISNGIGTLAGIFTPQVIDKIDANINDPQSVIRKWRIIFSIAAFVHFCGITFYAIFASGELQPWAQPPDVEQKVWSPSGTPYIKETSFNDEDQPQQHIINNRPTSYGATEHVPNNPFANPNTIMEEPVQPVAKDAYLHGTIDERAY